MRRRRPLAGVVGTLALLAASLVYAAWPGGSRFTVGTETTYVTGPLDKQGYVDHVTALNERLSKGITANKNANVLIWQALGPRPEGGSDMPSEYFEWLGIEPPPEEGAYLIRWQDYLKEHPKVGSEGDPPNDRIFRAGQWPWRDKDKPEIADWLKRNEKPLVLVLEDTARPEYYNPLVPERTEDWSPGLLGALLPNVQQCRELAMALTCRAMLRVTE